MGCCFKGPYIIMRTIGDVTIEKSSEDCDKNDKKLCFINAKAVNIFCCGLILMNLIEHLCAKTLRKH